MLFIYCLFVQVRKISPVFKLAPSTIYLVKEFDNVAVFPHKSTGRFNRSIIDPTAVYEVSGEELMGSDSGTPSAESPFGAYSGPTTG